MQKTLFSFFKKTPKSEAASDGRAEKKISNSGAGRTEGHSGFPAGSLVWSKLPGYPWWPSMVCNHPTAGKTYRKGEIHVQFLDTPVTRSWVPLSMVKKWGEKVVKEGGPDLPSWLAGVEQAEKAVGLTDQERLDTLLVTLLPSDEEESEVWRKDSGVSLTSGSSSPARRLSFPDRSVTPSGSRSYIDRTPVGSRSSTPSLLAMRSSTPSLTTMRSSTPCLLPRPITPSCGRSSTPSLPSCRSTTPSLPSLLPRPTTPSTVGGRPTTPSLGSLLPRPTTPSRSLSARRGSLSLPLRSSDTPLHSRSSRPSLPCFSTISSRSGRPSPSPILSSSSMMGVVGEPSLARRWDSTPSLEVSSSLHPFHWGFPSLVRAGELVNL